MAVKNCIFTSNKTRLALSMCFLDLRFGILWDPKFGYGSYHEGDQSSKDHNEILGKRDRNFRNKIYSILVMFVRICSRTRNITSLHDSVNESTESFLTIFQFAAWKRKWPLEQKNGNFENVVTRVSVLFYGFSSGQMANSIIANSFNLHTRLLDIKYRIERPQIVFVTICTHFTGNFRW